MQSTVSWSYGSYMVAFIDSVFMIISLEASAPKPKGMIRTQWETVD